MFLANSPWAHDWHELLHLPVAITAGEVDLSLSLLHWINDGLMGFFFFLVGLEIKREVLVGDLASVRKAMLPAFAAVGGMAVPALIFVAFRMFQPANWFADVLVPLALFFVAVLIRAGRPFLPEMILLEMCPLRSKDPAEITLARRARALHRPVGSDVGSRWLAVSFTLLVIFAGFFYSLVWLRGIATGYWNMGLVTLLVLYPLALWVVGGLSVLVRMLAYLDTRIRLEGWDVELAVRAEAMRQFGDEAGIVASPTFPGEGKSGGGTLLESGGGAR